MIQSSKLLRKKNERSDFARRLSGLLNSLWKFELLTVMLSENPCRKYQNILKKVGYEEKR